MSILAAYTFDAGSSHDDSGNGNNGTDTNIVYGAPAYLGAKGAAFNGATSKVDLPPIVLGGGAWGFRVAVYLGNNSSVNLLGGGGGFPGQGHGLQVGTVSGGTASFYYMQSSGFPKTIGPVAGGVGQYFEVAVTQSLTGTLKGYIDGVLKNTYAAVGDNITLSIVGKDVLPASLLGSLDEVVVWDRDPSDDEIAFAFGKPFTAPGFPDGPTPPLPPPPPLPPISFVSPTAAAQLAAVDFGQDIDAAQGLSPFLRLIGGLDNLGQALLHRLSTPRGSLPYDANYGFDVRELLNETMSPTRQAQAQTAIAGECRKDERVQACAVAFNFSKNVLHLTLNLTTSAGPFRLVVLVTSLSVQLLAVQ